MQQSLSSSALHFLGNQPAGAGSISPFLDTLLANLYAAARHAALGHAAPSFRECSAPACIEAANLIPELVPAEVATDTELDAILGKVLIGLEREGTSFLASKPS